MGVDVVDVFGFEAGARDGLPHRSSATLAEGRRLRDVRRVRGDTVAGELDDGRCASLQCVLQPLYHEDSAALADDEAVALGVEGA